MTYATARRQAQALAIEAQHIQRYGHAYVRVISAMQLEEFADAIQGTNTRVADIKKSKLKKARRIYAMMDAEARNLIDLDLRNWVQVEAAK